MLNLALISALGIPVVLKQVLHGRLISLPKSLLSRNRHNMTVLIMGVLAGAALSNVWASFIKRPIPDQAIAGIYVLAVAYPVVNLIMRLRTNGINGFKKSSFYSNSLRFLVGALVGFFGGKLVSRIADRPPISEDPQKRLTRQENMGFRALAGVYIVLTVILTLKR